MLCCQYGAPGAAVPDPNGAVQVEPKPDAGMVDENKENASVAAVPQKLENMVAGSELSKA